MRLTIIPSDGLVGIDNHFFSDLDLSTCAIPANVHALQWYETEGELEFVSNPDRTKPQNELLAELPAWATSAKAVWDEFKAVLEAQAQADQAAAETKAKEAVLETPLVSG